MPFPLCATVLMRDLNTGSSEHVTERKPFNYDAFLTAYRARCAQFGIDPAQGASSYAQARIAADRSGQAAQTEENPYWWVDSELWTESAPYHDAVEEEALERLQRAAFAGKHAAHKSYRDRRGAADDAPDACPYCDAPARYQHFWRKNTSGRQFVCTKCNRRYTPSRGKHRYSEEMRDRAFELHQEGLTKVEIATALKVHRHTVSNWLQSYDVMPRTHEFSTETRQEALRLAAEGKSGWEIGKALGVHRNTINKWLAAAREQGESEDKTDARG